MGLVALIGERSRLVVRAGALHVEKDGVVLRSLQTHELSELHLYGAADLSPAARNLLLREGIDVTFLTPDGRFRGRLVGFESASGARRLAQMRFVCDPVRRLGFAREIVRAKIANQRAVLLRRQERLRDEAVADALGRLRALAAAAQDAADLDVLRGLEGAAAASYFGVFDRVLRSSELRFNGRNRYPPRDPVNAALSFGYSLLLARVDAAVRAAGLDVACGVLHEAGRGAPALALDLMEELRAMVDGVVLGLLNLRQLGPEDFRSPSPEELGERAELADGAVFLADVGRAVLLRALERRLAEPAEHPTRGDRWPMRELIREQAQQAARLFEGEATAWRPLVIRS